MALVAHIPRLEVNIVSLSLFPPHIVIAPVKVSLVSEGMQQQQPEQQKMVHHSPTDRQIIATAAAEVRTMRSGPRSAVVCYA